MRKIKKNHTYSIRQDNNGLWDIIDDTTGRIVSSGYLVEQIAQSRAKTYTAKAEGGHHDNTHTKQKGTQSNLFQDSAYGETTPPEQPIPWD